MYPTIPSTGKTAVTDVPSPAVKGTVHKRQDPMKSAMIISARIAYPVRRSMTESDLLSTPTSVRTLIWPFSSISKTSAVFVEESIELFAHWTSTLAISGFISSGCSRSILKPKLGIFTLSVKELSMFTLGHSVLMVPSTAMMPRERLVRKDVADLLFK